jgi:hypothetical protein
VAKIKTIGRGEHRGMYMIVDVNFMKIKPGLLPVFVFMMVKFVN